VVHYRRNLIPGASFFFTVVLADRRSSALTDNIAALREAFRKVRSERPFEIDAIVILPEHLHTILTLPDGDADFPRRWHRIKTVFTQRLLAGGVTLSARDSTGRLLWQRRFWEHTIRDDADHGRHVDYIHDNPVKHGLVANPADWPHSSLHRFIRQGVLPADWGGASGNDGDFGEPDAT
jgi:putative transposase